MKYKCKKCRKEIEHPRRGMCLNCYRKVTGLSKSQTEIKKKNTKRIVDNIPKQTLHKLIEPTIKKESVKDNWWEKYQEGDILEQQELLAALPLVKELAKNGFPDLSTSEKCKCLSPEDLAKEQEKFNSHMLVTMLYSYINDLMELKDS